MNMISDKANDTKVIKRVTLYIEGRGPIEIEPVNRYCFLSGGILCLESDGECAYYPPHTYQSLDVEIIDHD